MATTITMPSLGESVSEGEVGKWLVQEGQRVEKDQPLVEIMTDKADSEIPATEGGVVTKIYAAEGDTISVGDTLCEIDESGEASADDDGGNGAGKAQPAEQAEAREKKKPEAREDEPADDDEEQRASSGGAGAPTSPTVRKLAREKGVDLASLTGSGEEGRITRDDVLRAAEGGEQKKKKKKDETKGGDKRDAVPPPPRQARDDQAPEWTPPTGAFRLPPYKPGPNDQVIPFSRRRRIIADHMVYSKLTAPHVVTMAECDLHATAKLRGQHKNEFKSAGLNLTFLAFVAAATCRALREFRELNARVLDDSYVLLGDVNLGVAVDTEEGLVVPVIPHADELSIRGLARAIDELAGRAREGKLAPDDLANKTFTISNPGRKGNLVGGAIISQPNVGILRMGEIKKRVVVVERDGEDLMAIHPVMHMALSYDPRVVDGVHANSFLWRITELLETAEFEL